MTLRILEKPSDLCGSCKEWGHECYCLCHVRPYTESYHELISHYGDDIKVEKVTKFESDYTFWDKIKSKLGFSV